MIMIIFSLVSIVIVGLNAVVAQNNGKLSFAGVKPYRAGGVVLKIRGRDGAQRKRGTHVG